MFFNLLGQRTLSSLDLPRTVSVANGLPSAISVGDLPSNRNQERNEGGTFDGSASHFEHNGRRRQKVPARDLPIQVLEKFSRVTRLARETTSQLFRESHSETGFGANKRKNHNQAPHAQPSNSASNGLEKVSIEIPEALGPLEVTFCCFTPSQISVCQCIYCGLFVSCFEMLYALQNFRIVIFL